MMKKVRTAGSKVLALLLAVCMMIGLVPVNTFAAGTTTETTVTTADNVQKVLDYAVQMKTANVKSNYTKGGFSWDTENKTTSWRYFNGVMMDAFLMTGKADFKTYADTFYSANIKDDGTILEYITGELDSVAPAVALFDLLDTGNAEKYKKAIQKVYTELEKQKTYPDCGGNYLHKQEDSDGDGVYEPTYSWAQFGIGLDGLYMAEMFLMECAKAIDNNSLTLEKADGTTVTSAEIYKEVYDRFTWVSNAMYDSETGLYNHGYCAEDATKTQTKDGKTTTVTGEKGTLNVHFWSRGIGWYAVALADAASMMPEQYKNNMISYLTKLFEGMLKYQDTETGMWYNVVNKDATLTENNGNRLETSGSSMMAYALMKAYNNGWVTAAKYGEAGLKAFNGVVNNKMTGEKGSYVVTDTYRSSGVCTTDADYCKNPYTDNEAKGTGALIMASTLATAAETKLAAEAPVETPETEASTEAPTEVPETPNKAPAQANKYYTYELVKTINKNEQYLIVNTNGGDGVALKNNNGSASAYSVYIDSDKITIPASDAEDVSWTFGSRYGTTYNISNDSKYVVPPLNTDTDVLVSSSTLVNVTINGTTGACSIVKKYENKQTKYLRYSNSKWDGTTASTNVYLYKKTGETSQLPITVSVSPSSRSLTVGGSEILTLTVKENGREVTNYAVEWTSSNTAVASVSNGTVTTNAVGTAEITAKITAVNGVTLATPKTVTAAITVREATTVEPSTPEEEKTNQQIYDELKAANKVTPSDQQPKYPADGAVRIKKFANGLNTSNGVTTVELDVAGISIKKNIDVVLVVDVSNSMAWSVENSSETGDLKKLPTNGQKDKLTLAMESATEFSEMLLKDAEGNATGNTVSFVTFAGYDSNRSKNAQMYSRTVLGNEYTNTEYIDSVQTVFTGETDAAKVKSAFENTKFVKTVRRESGKNSVDYALQIGKNDGTTVKGVNRGNTNYDYAFAEASTAVSELSRNGRETVVVFMTDGAPSHYNGKCANGSNGIDEIPSNSLDSDASYYTKTSYSVETWTTEIKKPNKFAVSLVDQIGKHNLYAVGFDLDNGGFGDLTWSGQTNKLKEALETIAGADEASKIPVTLADNAVELAEFYRQLASTLKYAGTNAQVTDIVKSDFTLQMKNTVTRQDGTEISIGFEPKIEVKAYELVTKAEAANSDEVGTRKDNGIVVETITFNPAGTGAYSDKKNGNIMTTEGDIITIAGEYVVYTKNSATGEEKFVWNLNQITDKELALTYPAYLKGSIEGQAENKAYATNERAYLEYVDNTGNYSEKEFPVPEVAWGSALTEIEYYLVNENGEPVNTIGEVIEFENRYILSGAGRTFTFNWNESITVEGKTWAPVGYTMYDAEAQYTVIAYSGTNGDSNLTINGSQSVSNTKTTRRIDNDNTCAQTKVAFAVILEGQLDDAGYSLRPDQVVVDYGKPIEIDILENDKDKIPSDATATVVGFRGYDNTLETSKKQKNSGSTSLTGFEGTFTVSGNKVRYTLNQMMDKVETVFAVVDITVSSNDHYYMYQKLEVIPATIMYYETDFAQNVFTFKSNANQWTTITDGLAAAVIQDTVAIGEDTYGYDTHYENDSKYSDASTYEVIGEGATVTTVKFSFVGTGFDLISMTGADEGSIRVHVCSDAAMTQREKLVSVMNRSDSNLSLYQIPVISIENLAYGTHYVEIGVLAPRSGSTNPALDNNGHFKFDAVRIYNPINIEATTDDANTAATAYMLDGEINPQISEVRNMILDGDATIGENVNGANGVVFVDLGKDVTNPTEYKNVGPNNEVYLKKDQAIGFKINKGIKLPASIDLGAKSAGGNAVTLAVKVYKVNGTSIDTTPYTTITKEITSSTAQFYDLFANAAIEDAFGTGNQIFVTVQNTSGSGILSITDLKVADGVTPAAAMVTFMVDEPVMARMFMLGAEPVEPEVPTEPEIPEESETPEESVVESNADILSAEFTKESVKQRATATIRIESTAEVETLTVIDAEGNTMSINIKNCKVNSDGNKEWKVAFKATTAGMQTFTVTGFDAEGNSGETKTASIEVRAK